MYFFIFVVIQGGLSFFTVMYLFGIVLFAASKIVFVIVLVMISMLARAHRLANEIEDSQKYYNEVIVMAPEVSL
jgi:N-acyl-L-homoserine lactone synthetase